MRKAFALMEVVVVLAILPVVLLALNGILNAFMRDVPQGVAVVSEQTTVLDLIDAIGRDVQKAVGLPDSTDGRILLIALPTGTVAYERTDGLVSRTVLGGQDPNAPRQWRLPTAVVDWQRWKQAEAAYAVEVHSYLNQTVHGHPQKMLVQTRVYLLNALGRVKEVE